MSSTEDPSDRERIDQQLADQSDTLTERDLQAVRKALRDEQSRSGVNVNRRQALALTAAGVGAGVLGGAGGLEATGAADASSGSSTGDLSHVQDLTVENSATIKGGASVKGGLDTDQLLNKVSNSKIQTAWDGLVVPVAPGLGMASAIDPSATATPVQDALDKIHAQDSGGVVLLPPGDTHESATITRYDGTGIIGWGIGDNGTYDWGSHLIVDAGSTAPGMDVSDTAWLWDHNYVLMGASSSTATGPAITYSNSSNNNDVWHHDIGRLGIKRWSNIAIDGSSNGPFESTWGTVAIRGVDAGDKSAVVDLGNIGPQNTINTLSVYPSDSRTGSDSTILKRQFGDVEVTSLNMGGTAGLAGDVYDSNWKTGIADWNWEPSGQNSTYQHIFKVRGRHRTHLGAGRKGGGTAQFAFGIINGTNTELGHKYGWATGTYGTNILELVSTAATNIIFDGPSSAVTNTAGTSSNTVSCLADQSFVG